MQPSQEGRSTSQFAVSTYNHKLNQARNNFVNEQKSKKQ